MLHNVYIATLDIYNKTQSSEFLNHENHFSLRNLLNLLNLLKWFFNGSTNTQKSGILL